MYKPAHPGEILKEDIITPLNLGMEETAKHLNITRKHLSDICYGKSRISAKTALKLEQAFGAPNAVTWMRMQAKFDVWEAKQNDHNPIGPIKAA